MAKRAKKSAKKLGKKSGPKDSAYVNSKEKYENCNHRFQRHYYTWNKVAEDLYGNSTKEAIGKSLSLVVLPDDIKQLLLNIDRIRLSKHVGNI